MKEFINTILNPESYNSDIVFKYILLLLFITIMGGLIYDKFKDDKE